MKIIEYDHSFLMLLQTIESHRAGVSQPELCIFCPGTSWSQCRLKQTHDLLPARGTRFYTYYAIRFLSI